MVELTVVLVILLLAHTFEHCWYIRTAAKERKELEDLLMAVAHPTVQRKTEPIEGDVTYVDEETEYRLSPSYNGPGP